MRDVSTGLSFNSEFFFFLLCFMFFNYYIFNDKWMIRERNRKLSWTESISFLNGLSKNLDIFCATVLHEHWFDNCNDRIHTLGGRILFYSRETHTFMWMRGHWCDHSCGSFDFILFCGILHHVHYYNKIFINYNSNILFT